MQPGEALELQNFEPDIEGGYRRINGFCKYVSAVVPQTSASTEQVLMVATFGDFVVAAEVKRYLLPQQVGLVGQKEIVVEQVQEHMLLKDLTLTVTTS